LKNKLFHNRIGQLVRLSDTYKDVFTYWNISQHSVHCRFMWDLYFQHHHLYEVRFLYMWL
jgi:hypothetical protein